MYTIGAKTRINASLLYGFIIFLVLNLLFPILPCHAEGTTIYVDDSNTAGPWEGTSEHPFNTISTGILAAIDSNTVYVMSGTYNERLIITKNLTLTGENKETTIINGGNSGHVIYGYGTTTCDIHITIAGFTIQNAGGVRYHNIAFSYVSDSDISENKMISSDQSGGIQLDHCRDLSIHNNIISNKIAGLSLILTESSIIQNNNIYENQKGIHLSSYSNANQILGNTLHSNSEFGVYVSQSSSNVFSRNDFTDNNENAFDSATNSWSVNNQGNYWDDYNNYDSDENGVGDVPYEIAGGANSDAFPLGYFLDDGGQQGGDNQAPVAYLPSITPNPAIVGETVYFSGEGADTDGYITGYAWRSSKGDNLPETSSFSITTLTVGTHTIYFKVQDNDGDWSSEKTVTLTILASQNNLPTAYIDSISPNPVQYGSPIHFSGYGIDTDGSVIAWLWSSDRDGDLSAQPSFTTLSLSAGTHLITFKVKDNDNTWSNETTQQVIVQSSSSSDPSNQPPVANVGGPYTGSINIDITFDGSESYEPNGTITLYRWSFDDGFSTTGMTPKHQYTSPGTYTVSLEVTDDDGQTATATTTVQISSQPPDNGGIGTLLSQIPIPSPLLLGLIGIIIAVVVILSFIVMLKRMR